nr:EOG090X0D3U [Lepidurus arcticus]
MASEESKQEEKIHDPENVKILEEVKLSKNALKRKLKAEKWEATKVAKRAQERAKRKLRRKGTGRLLNKERNQLKQTTMANSQCKVHVVIDLSFDDYMAEKDIAKCVKQVHRSYSLNRRVPNPVQFYVTSLNGKSLEDIEKKQGYQNWDVNFHKEHFSEILPKDQVIYLTSESNNEINDLEDGKVYVIGGLVDHNAHKGLCHSLAVEKGYNHARLPLDKFVEMKTRKVITIDQGRNRILRPVISTKTTYGITRRLETKIKEKSIQFLRIKGLRMGRVAATALGGSLLLIQFASYKGYIKINWSRVNKDLEKATNKLTSPSDGKKLEKALDKARQFAFHNGYLSSGYVGGFLLGLAC